MRCAMIRCVATVSRAQQWAWLPGYDVPELKLEFVYDYKGRWRDPKSGTLQNCSSASGFVWFVVCCRAGAVAPGSLRRPAAASGAGLGGTQPPSTRFVCAAYSSGV